jgi:hypothetical protein
MIPGSSNLVIKDSGQVKFICRLLPILILTNPLVGSGKVNAYPSTIFLPG